MTRNIATCTIKIDKSAFIRDLVIKKNLTDCNANVIPIKAGSSIKMFELDNYDETDIYIYQ